MSLEKDKKDPLDSPGLDAVPVLLSPPAAEPQRTWRSIIWPSLDLPKEEARFLLKLDLTLLSSAALGVTIRYLDQVNLINGSGMKEDLELFGKELNYAAAFWSAGYVFGQIPSNLILTRVNTSLYVAFLEFAWTVATFATAGIKTTNHLYAVRFLVGLFEAGHFGAVIYVCSSWFKPHELARRNTIIQVATQIGPLFSGFLMAAVYSGLNGKLGLAGWRWLFIICGVISLPCVAWTAIAMPKLPSRSKPNWLFSAREIEIGRQRVNPADLKIHEGWFKWRDVLKWHTTWHAWLFPLYFLFIVQLGQSGGSMIFWVKSYNVKGQKPVFSVAQINLIPLGINILNIFCALTASWIADNLPGARRWPVLVGANLLATVFPIALAATPVHPVHKGSRWALYYLTALGTCTGGIIWTAVNETSRHDPEKRAYVSALMNAIGNLFQAWIPIFTFPANKQPYIVTGNYVNAGFAFGGVLISLVIAYFDERERRRRAAEGEEGAGGADTAVDVKGI
ncbi:Pantothenate transporter FEN2 [Vanrija pseudolonga]|uniref:Pantothenate transporter FEN2 n=1 Tax=Vanrija pseudolonga TaxID=143232 RepID=A0AAF0YG90_9TREE|nr:Pantothenate transporter FEN2 [Vanrija pseudolonga]